MNMQRRGQFMPPFHLLLIFILTLAAAGCAPQTPRVVDVPTARPTNTLSAPAAPTEAHTIDFSPSVPLPSEPVTLTFASWVSGSASYQFLADEFHTLYPNITIKF